MKRSYEERRRRRVRRLKKVLRLLPQKSHLERYPLLKHCADRARKSAFLWSFRRQEAFPAFLFGWILCFMPLLGFHFILAVALSFLLRSNVLIMCAIQLATMPLTLPLIWPLVYQVGCFTIGLLSPGNENFLLPFDSLSSAGLSLLQMGAVLTLGGVLVGIFLGYLSILFYEIFSRRLRNERRLLADRSVRVIGSSVVSDDAVLIDRSSSQ